MSVRSAGGPWVLAGLPLFGLPALALAQGDNVIQRSNFDPAPTFDYADVWGYRGGGVDLALVADANGVYFVNVTVPNSPTQVAYVTGAIPTTSLWRDMKTFGTHAYIVTDDGGGLQIVDLTNPLLPLLVNTITADFLSAHNLWIDEALGLLFAVGADTRTTSDIELHVYDVGADEVNPPHVFTFTDSYVHDMYSRDGVAYLAAISDGFTTSRYDGLLVTADLTDLPNSMPILGKAVPDGAFCHNVWLDASGEIAYTTDEENGGHVSIFDVSDPTDIAYLGNYVNDRDPGSIVHNVLVLGDIAYISWYKAGVELLDLTMPAYPRRLGFFDTFAGSGGGFDGAWGVYALDETRLFVSDIATGLYVLDIAMTDGFVAGTVTDAVSLSPLSDVTVTLVNGADDPFGVTRPGGVYRFVDAPGSYQVEVASFFHVPETRNVTINAGATTTEDVALDPLPTGAMEGVVRNADTSDPIAGATVTMDGTGVDVTTDGTGMFFFEPVPEGLRSFSADAFGFAPRFVLAPIQPPGTTSIDLELFPALFADDFETDLGWTVGDVGDDATRGTWERADPLGSNCGTTQPEDDHTPGPGTQCFVTEQAATAISSLGQADVDGGKTTLVSPIWDLSSASAPELSLWYWYTNVFGANTESPLAIDLSDNGGGSWTNAFTTITSTHGFEPLVIRITDFVAATSQVRARIVARDEVGAIVEAAIDDVMVYETDGALVATESAPAPPVTRLLSPSPNPSRSVARLRFELAATGRVALDVYDIQGRRVRRLLEGTLSAGARAASWDGRDEAGRRTAPGIYFLRLEAGDASFSSRLVRAR